MNWIQSFLTAIAIHKADAGAHHAAGAPVPHGAAQHTDVARWLFLPACTGHVSSGTPTTRGNYAVVSGEADLNEPHVNFSIKVPDDFVSFTSLQAVWICSAAAGNLYWYLYNNYASCGEAYGLHYEEPGYSTTPTRGANILNCDTPEDDPLVFPNLAVGDFIGVNFYRKGDHANDTLDATFYLFGLLFNYMGHQ